MKIIEKSKELIIVDKMPKREVKCEVEFCGKIYTYKYNYNPELLQSLEEYHAVMNPEQEIISAVKNGAYYEVVHKLAGDAYDAFCEKSKESYPDKKYIPWEDVTTTCSLKSTYESIVHSVEVTLKSLGLPSSLQDDYLDQIEYIPLTNLEIK